MSRYSYSVEEKLKAIELAESIGVKEASIQLKPAASRTAEFEETEDLDNSLVHYLQDTNQMNNVDDDV